MVNKTIIISCLYNSVFSKYDYFVCMKKYYNSVTTINLYLSLLACSTLWPIFVYFPHNFKMAAEPLTTIIETTFSFVVFFFRKETQLYTNQTVVYSKTNQTVNAVQGVSKRLGEQYVFGFYGQFRTRYQK